jgi:hypothetical protein
MNVSRALLVGVCFATVSATPAAHAQGCASGQDVVFLAQITYTYRRATGRSSL